MVVEDPDSSRLAAPVEQAFVSRIVESLREAGCDGDPVEELRQWAELARRGDVKSRAALSWFIQEAAGDVEGALGQQQALRQRQAQKERSGRPRELERDQKIYSLVTARVNQGQQRASAIRYVAKGVGLSERAAHSAYYRYRNRLRETAIAEIFSFFDRGGHL